MYEISLYHPNSRVVFSLPFEMDSTDGGCRLIAGADIPRTRHSDMMLDAMRQHIGQFVVVRNGSAQWFGRLYPVIHRNGGTAFAVE